MSRLLAVVPVLNLWDTYTRPMLQALVAPDPLALVLIDNGSDGSGERVQELAGRFASIEVIRNGVNRGVAASWNQGVRWGLANGFDRFLILNNDIVVHPEAIGNLERVFERDGVYLAAMYDVADEVASVEQLLHFPPRPASSVPAPSFSAFLIGRKTIEAMTAHGDPVSGLFDEGFSPAYFEDNDYHYRLKLYLGDAAVVTANDALFYHYTNGTQKHALPAPVVSNRRFEQNRAYYVRKWGGPPGQEWFRSPFGVR